MKTKCFLTTCLLFTVSYLCAQIPDYPDFPPPPDNPEVDDTRTVVWEGNWVIADDVEYNGELIDRIYGPITWKNVYHYRNGEFVFGISTAKGEIVSLVTGEIFRVNEQDKIYVESPTTPGGMWYFHNNLKGNLGSHYITSGQAEMNTMITVFTKAIVIRKKK